MQSNGGRLSAAATRNNLLTALFGGPAAGVVGAIRLAGRSECSCSATMFLPRRLAAVVAMAILRGGRLRASPIMRRTGALEEGNAQARSASVSGGGTRYAFTPYAVTPLVVLAIGLCRTGLG